MFLRHSVWSVAERIADGLENGTLDLRGTCDPRGLLKYRIRTWLVFLIAFELTFALVSFGTRLVNYPIPWLAGYGHLVMLCLIFLFWRDLVAQLGWPKNEHGSKEEPSL